MPSPPTREERWRPVLALMDAVRRTSEPPELEQARDLLAGTGGEVDPVVALVALRYCTEIQHVPMPDEVGPIIEGGGA